MTKEFLEKCLAGGLSLDQIARSVGKHPSTVSHHLKKYGLTPLGHEIHAPNQKVDGDRLRHLISDGATVREAAATFGVGYSTIRYWLRRLGLETRRMQRLRQSRAAADASGARQIRQCPRHGRVPHVRRADGDSFRCIKCRSEAVSKRRRTVKKLLVERAGGRCQLCGYDRHPAALHFHHLDPRAKNFIVSRNGVTRSYSEAKAEADKCVLLCGNCHAEVEVGVIQLPNRLTLKLPEDRAS
jgi:transposase/transcription elongation factor Elf1